MRHTRRQGWGRVLASVATAMLTATLSAPAAPAQEAKAKKAATPAAQSPKAGAGEKVCRYTFPSGEKRAWICKKEEPCCAWDEINYVKCGSVAFKCL